MKSSGPDKFIVIGIGNDSRQDDGLGWALLNSVTDLVGDFAELVYRYQLNIEDADLIQDADLVLFVDACRDSIEGGSVVEECTPNGDITFTTHALSPSAVLALCQQVYEKEPASYVLKLQGFEWELKTGLTDSGKKSLESGINAFKSFLKRYY